ncbi:nucleotidyltransferase family protein [Pontibacter chitinilyticus]|uniref:nucleotidyltransferase family protein n=1 Tax=Pontibacter chitinilyticus TaxID=2674989 RepID=UPI003219749B
MKTTGLILLAAGASTRLGEPKQLLMYEGESLLQRAIRTARASACQPVVVVLGANAEALLPDVSDLHVVQNPEWEEGMASSIRSGVAALLALSPAVSGVVLMVCDQPFADSDLLEKLVAEKNLTGKGIIASAYSNTLGTPVLFTRPYFQTLLALRGKEGAKKLILTHAHDVATVPFPQGIIDVDTSEDYELLQQQQEDER